MYCYFQISTHAPKVKITFEDNHANELPTPNLEITHRDFYKQVADWIPMCVEHRQVRIDGLPGVHIAHIYWYSEEYAYALVYLFDSFRYFRIGEKK